MRAYMPPVATPLISCWASVWMSNNALPPAPYVPNLTCVKKSQTSAFTS